MSFQEFLAWLSLASLEDCEASDVLVLVSQVLDTLPEDDAEYALLLEIEDELIEDRVPIEKLLQLFARHQSSGSLNEVETLVERYRSAAQAYEPEQWQSNYYLELVRSLEEDDEAALLSLVEALRERITAAWDKYSGDFSLLPGASAESEAGHKLMQEAFERWMEALYLVEQSAPQEEAALAAEQAVRLLAAVKQLDQDVQRSVQALRPQKFTY